MAVRPGKKRKVYIYGGRAGQIREMQTIVSVGRRDNSPPTSRFFACVYFKHGGWSRDGMTSKMPNACANGRNPRRALAGAFRAAAKHVSGRSGAFAAIDGYSKSNRRNRRARRAAKRRY